MNKRRLVASIVLSACLFGTGFAVPGRPKDEELEARLFDLIENLGTARMKPITVAEIEKLVTGICTMKASSGVMFGANYESLSYILEYKGLQPGCGKFGLELLTEGRGELYSRVVLSARLSFTTNSGVSYYNDLLPPIWRIESEKNEPKSEPHKGTENRALKTGSGLDIRQKAMNQWRTTRQQSRHAVCFLLR